MADVEVVWGIFARLLAVVFAIAFLVIRAEVVPLTGRRGLAPVAERLRRIRAELGPWRAVVTYPSLLWIGASDRALRWLPVAGIVAAVLAACGLASGPMFAAAWVIYLSFDVALGLTFPWESLLLEAGFLAMLLPWLAPLPELRMTQAPEPLLMFAFHGLLFRLLFGFGKTKFSRDALHEPGYLRSFLISQPMPSPLGWRAHRLPLRLLVVSHALLFVTEMALPFGIFLPGWPRLAAAAGFTALMIAIQATGNFGFFNILVVVLCVPLFDPRAVTGQSLEALASPYGLLLAVAVAWAAFGGLLHLPFNSYVACTWTGWPAWGAAKGVPRAILAVLRAAMPFRTVHAYGVFPPRIGPALKFLPVVEGSMDGVEWETFHYRYMPSTEASPPRFVAPHCPRLDHLALYEAFALGPGNYLSTVFGSGDPYAFSPVQSGDRLLQRLMERDSPVRTLFGRVPFGGAPPALMRMRRYAFAPTTPAELRATGRYWHREFVDDHSPPRAADATLFQRWLPVAEQLHPDQRWARRRVPRIRPLLHARSLDEVRQVLGDRSPALWDAFWEEVIPAARIAASTGWMAIPESAARLRASFTPLDLDALDTILGAVATALLERMEPHLFGRATPPLTMPSYFHASLAAHAMILEGRDAIQRALRDHATLVAHAARGREDAGLMLMTMFRFETMTLHTRSHRLMRRVLPPQPPSSPVVPGFIRVIERLAEVLPGRDERPPHPQ